jgi:oxaloacetate decarboxylase beta subunit
MFGNLLRASGAVERISKAAQNELANLVTLLLVSPWRNDEIRGLPHTDYLLIMALGLFAFILIPQEAFSLQSS